jgi:hypothetical protein
MGGAIAGCSVVVSQRPAEQELFGSVAHYCNPADIASIRSAVLTAHRSHSQNAGQRQKLSTRLAELCAPPAVADRLLTVYHRLAPRTTLARSAA